MTERHDRIREIAYFLWLEEGRPVGQAERHWQAAEILFDSEGGERKRLEGEPPGDSDRSQSDAPGADAASQTARRRGVPTGE